MSNAVTLSRANCHDLFNGIDQLVQGGVGNQLSDLGVYAKDGTRVNFSRIMICSMSPFLTDILLSVPCVYDPWPSLITDISLENLAVIFNFVSKGCIEEELEPELINAFKSLGIPIESFLSTKEPSQGCEKPIQYTSLDVPNDGEDQVFNPKTEISIPVEEDENELNLFLEDDDFDTLDGNYIFNEVTGVKVLSDTPLPKILPSRRSKRKSYAVTEQVHSDDEPSPKKHRCTKESSDDEDFDLDTLIEVDLEVKEEEEEGTEKGLKIKQSVLRKEEAKGIRERKLKREVEREKKRKAKELDDAKILKMEKQYSSKIGARLVELQEKGISYENIHVKKDYRVTKLKNSVQPWALIDHIYPRYVMSGRHCCTLCRFKTTLGQILEQHMIHHTDNDLDPDYFHCLIPECRERSGSLAKWGEHASKAHSEQVYGCPKCDMYCKSLCQRTVHLANVHNVSSTSASKADHTKDPIQCAHCGTKYSQKKTYKDHLEYESTYHNNNCPHENCDFNFSSWAEHTEHINKEHGQMPLYVCGICPETFVLKSKKQKHREEQHANSAAMLKKYKICQTCGVRSSTMTLHMALVHGKDKKGFCKQCGEHFENIMQHRETEHHNKIVKVACKHCGFLVPETRFDSHVCDIEKSKTSIADFVTKECFICVKKFENMLELQKHLKIAHKEKMDEIKVFSCKLCDQTFKIKKDLMEHNLTHLSEEKKVELTCHFCQKLCSTRANKHHHIRNSHVLPFVCNDCNARFKSEEQLTEHIVQATCVKRTRACATCDVCGKVVPKKYLPMHIMNSHIPDNEKPYQCQYCQRGFGIKVRWQEHENTHTKAKPHMCGFCGWAFNSAASLATHEIKLHNRAPSSSSFAGRQNRIDALMKTHEKNIKN